MRPVPPVAPRDCPVSTVPVLCAGMALILPLLAACAPPERLDPHALEVYAHAVQAAKGLKRFEYRASVTDRGARRDDAGADKPDPKDATGFLVRIDFEGASEAMRRATSLPPASVARMRVERLAPAAVETLVVGAEHATVIPAAGDSGRRTVRRADWAEVGKPFFGALPDWIFFVRVHADPLATEWGGATRIVEARFFGVERFDGVDCDVVGIERECDIGSRVRLDGVRADPTQVSRVRELLAIGQADHLPRSISVLDLGAAGVMPDSVRVLRLTELRADEAVAGDLDGAIDGALDGADNRRPAEVPGARP